MWSHDGSRVVFASTRLGFFAWVTQQADLWIMDVVTGR
jgi:hypothetical protein